MSERVWLITGGSTGIGRSLAKQVLEGGDRAAVSARKPEALRELTEQFGESALALTLDVTQRDLIAEAVDKTEKHFGKIDVLVNNAGYGYFSAIEEGGLGHRISCGVNGLKPVSARFGRSRKPAAL